MTNTNLTLSDSAHLFHPIFTSSNYNTFQIPKDIENRKRHKTERKLVRICDAILSTQIKQHTNTSHRLYQLSHPGTRTYHVLGWQPTTVWEGYYNECGNSNSVGNKVNYYTASYIPANNFETLMLQRNFPFL